MQEEGKVIRRYKLRSTQIPGLAVHALISMLVGWIASSPWLDILLLRERIWKAKRKELVRCGERMPEATEISAAAGLRPSHPLGGY